jgi:hypothetical protein
MQESFWGPGTAHPSAVASRHPRGKLDWLPLSLSCADPAQSRPNIFDLEIRAPEVLYETVVEVEEEVVLPLGDTPGT